MLLLSGELVGEISKYFTFARSLSVHLVCLVPLPILNGYALLPKQKSEPFDLAGATAGVLSACLVWNRFLLLPLHFFVA